MAIKQTLLEMTQDILSAMDSDEVNDIDDTSESKQVVDHIIWVYNDIVADQEMPEHFEFFELEASGDNNKPVLMTVPSDVLELRSVKYDVAKSTDTRKIVEDIKWRPLGDFLTDTFQLSTDESNIASMAHVIDGDTIDFNFYNDRAPQFYTTFDDRTIIFDSYDSAVDTTLQKSKTVCWGQKEPTVTRGNSFVFDLDAKQYMQLKNKSAAFCFANIKQASNAGLERMARDNKISGQKSKVLVKGQTSLDRVANFGRK